MTYETIKANTKKGETVKARSKAVAGYTLSDCYERCSHRKNFIYEEWLKEAYYLGAHNFHITSYNSQVFCIGFETDNYYYHITPAHNYRVAKEIF